MAVGVAAIVVMSYSVVNRSGPPSHPEPAASNAIAGPLHVLVIGDSYTGGSDEGGVDAAGWPALVADQLGDGVSVGVAAEGASGYVSEGSSGHTFRDLIEAANGNYDVVVVFGSRNDDAPPDEVQGAAEAAFAAAREKSPDAALLVIGPPWVDPDPPSSVLEASAAVQAAAKASNATWVDPLAEGWFDDRPDLIGSDGVHPTDEGHQYMADLIEKRLTGLLG